MQVSVVIINYKVLHFLEQCLDSVMQATQGVDAEIIVVDNASNDGCKVAITHKFPGVICIENDVNIGFGRANNQGIAIAKGKYILILNPDTLIPENAIVACFDFMKSNPDAACVGVKMIDGQGEFLPESKRSLPTPWVSFCKIVGLSTLFPHSKWLAQYHLGYLDNNKTHQVDVLSGAFMFADATVLKSIEGFDEAYFMYGEDVDLSYRFTLVGKKNYYFPEVTVLHYKGESTKRDSVLYVKMFYEAMSIFADKHFSKGSSSLYYSTIQAAIKIRSSLAVLRRIFATLVPFFIDALLIFVGLYFIVDYWGSHIKYLQTGYPALVYQFNLPFYISTWLICIYLSGGYDKNHNSLKLIRGVLLGAAFIAIGYAFLDNSLRFSRAIIVLGTLFAIVQGLVWRWLFPKVVSNQVIVSEAETFRWTAFVPDSMMPYCHAIYNKIKQHAYYIPINEGNESTNTFLDAFQINEIVYHSSVISYQKIIENIALVGNQVQHKIITPSSVFLIGSNSKYSNGDAYLLQKKYALASVYHQRNKRIGDVIIGLLVVIFFIFGGFLKSTIRHLFANVWQVVAGKKTWIGYSTSAIELPKLKKSVLKNSCNYNNITKSSELELFDMLYACDYSIFIDIECIQKYSCK